MTEHIISDERLERINRTAYLAGAGGSEVYTQMGADGPAVVRCRDCVHMDMVIEFAEGDGWSDSRMGVPFCFKHRRKTMENNFCSWAKRKESE